MLAEIFRSVCCLGGEFAGGRISGLPYLNWLPPAVLKNPTPCKSLLFPWFREMFP